MIRRRDPRAGMTARQRDAYDQGQLDAMLGRTDDAHRRYCRRWPSEAANPATPVTAYGEYAAAYGAGYRDQVAAQRELDAVLGWRVS